MGSWFYSAFFLICHFFGAQLYRVPYFVDWYWASKLPSSWTTQRSRNVSKPLPFKLHFKYHKIPKISPGAYFFIGSFWRGLSTKGNLCFEIDWASLIVGSHPQAIGKMCRKKRVGENRFKKTRTRESYGYFWVNWFG